MGIYLFKRTVLEELLHSKDPSSSGKQDEHFGYDVIPHALRSGAKARPPTASPLPLIGSPQLYLGAAAMGIGHPRQRRGRTDAATLLRCCDLAVAA